MVYVASLITIWIVNVVEKSDFMPGLCHTIWSIADNFKVVRMSLVYQVSVCRLTILQGQKTFYWFFFSKEPYLEGVGYNCVAPGKR